MHDLIDIGANLTHDSFDPDRDKVIARAADVGVRRLIVTGASRGIGAGISKELGKSGARIAIQYNSDEKSALEIEQIVGNESKIFKANLKDPF